MKILAMGTSISPPPHPFTPAPPAQTNTLAGTSDNSGHFSNPSMAPYCPQNKVPTTPYHGYKAFHEGPLLTFESHRLPLSARVANHPSLPGAVPVLALEVPCPGKLLSIRTVGHPVPALCLMLWQQQLLGDVFQAVTMTLLMPFPQPGD